MRTRSVIFDFLKFPLLDFDIPAKNVVKACILVPAKPHGPENSVAGEQFMIRSGSCNRKIGKS